MITIYQRLDAQKLSCKTLHKNDEWNHPQIAQTSHLQIPPCALFSSVLFCRPMLITVFIYIYLHICQTLRKKHFEKGSVEQHLERKVISCKIVSHRKIIVTLKIWRSLHSILFSALLEYSNATYSDLFNDLVNLGLMPPDEVNKYFFSDFTSDRRVVKLSNPSKASQHQHWYQNNVCGTALWTVT